MKLNEFVMRAAAGGLASPALLLAFRKANFPARPAVPPEMSGDEWEDRLDQFVIAQSAQKQQET